MGVMALTATTSGYFGNTIRIKRVSLWAPPPAIGSLTMVSLKYADTNGGASPATLAGPNNFQGDSSMEPDRPARCFLKPPKDTYWDWFQSVANGGNYIVITAPIGSVLEIEFSHYLDNSGTITAGPVLVGATPGVIYNRPMTGGGGGTWVPHTSCNTI
jgi:hypothetical protein